jgi:hypothetical protein
MKGFVQTGRVLAEDGNKEESKDMSQNARGYNSRAFQLWVQTHKLAVLKNPSDANLQNMNLLTFMKNYVASKVGDVDFDELPAVEFMTNYLGWSYTVNSEGGVFTSCYKRDTGVFTDNYILAHLIVSIVSLYACALLYFWDFIIITCVTINIYLTYTGRRN